MFGERGDILNLSTGLASMMDRILLGSHKHPVNVETLLERTAEFLRAGPSMFQTEKLTISAVCLAPSIVTGPVKFFCHYYFCLWNESLFAEREVRRLHTLCLPFHHVPLGITTS